ncbi:septum formation family protein [Microbacterium sp. NPDC057659]|uniref:septum formation family protein n=1 Tax=Microbacterium sp. NPDC057659 TaxID=3346198 RepID=UPI00366BE4F7
MSIPAGWYDDGSGRRRWWDGTQWTEHFATVEAAPVPVFEPPYVAPAPQVEQFHQAHSPLVAPGYPGGPHAAASGYLAGAPVAAPAARRASALGWVALAVSLAGAVLSCIPPIFVIGLLVLLAGIVLSIIALVRPGARWPGVTGIIVSSVGALAVVTMLVSTAMISGIKELQGDTSPAPASSSGATPPGSEVIDWWELEVGDCMPSDQPYTDDSGEIVVVPCSEPHSDEVFHQYEMSQDVYPGDKATELEATETCREAFTDFVGTPFEDSELEYYGIWPNEDTWNQDDDRAVQCVVYDTDGDVVTGTLEGAAR